MSRIKRGVTTHAKHKRILDQAKGYYGRRKNTIRIAKQAVEKAGQYRSEEHTSELQSLMRISYAVFCLKKKKKTKYTKNKINNETIVRYKQDGRNQTAKITQHEYHTVS